MKHECECGNPRRPTQIACARCSFLDGKSKAELQMISALREHGGLATSYTLANTIGITQRNARRALRALIERGRVMRTRDGANEALFCLCLSDHRAKESSWQIAI